MILKVDKTMIIFILSCTYVYIITVFIKFDYIIQPDLSNDIDLNIKVQCIDFMSKQNIQFNRIHCIVNPKQDKMTRKKLKATTLLSYSSVMYLYMLLYGKMEEHRHSIDVAGVTMKTNVNTLTSYATD